MQRDPDRPAYRLNRLLTDAYHSPGDSKGAGAMAMEGAGAKAGFGTHVCDESYESNVALPTDAYAHPGSAFCQHHIS